MSASHSPFGIARRLGWGVVDQGVASLSNFAVGIALARTLGADGFGAFTLAYVTFSVILNASRGIATDPLLVRFSGKPEAEWRVAVSASTATAVAIGVVGGAGCLVFSLILPGSLKPAFIALAFCLPAMLMQDSWRFAFFASGRPVRALANDLLWCGILLATLTALHVTGHLGVVPCVLALGGTGVVTAVVGGFQSGVRPRLTRVPSWVVDHRSLGWRYLIENLSAGASRQIMMFGLGGIAGLSAVGQVRAAEMLMGPFLVILMGLSQVAVPEARHVIDRTPRRLLGFCLALAGGMAGTAAVWGALVWIVLPMGVGALLLGELWVPASVLIPAVVCHLIAGGFTIGFQAGVRALGAAPRSLKAQLTDATCYAGGGTLGAWVDGAEGTCWGVAIGTVVSALMWWYQFRRALAEHLAEVADGVPPTHALHPNRKDPDMPSSPSPGDRPALTIGLPVYNGEEFLEESLDALLAQTYDDFELIISDNASTDATAQICQRYAARDDRIRYLRQPENIGAARNHNVLVPMARGRYFKWASHDDLYAPELVEQCVAALETRPEAVLAHSWDAVVDPTGEVVLKVPYALDTANPDPAARLRSLLRTPGGNDFYGVIRTDVLRSVAPHGTYYNADRTFMAGLVLAGPFVQVPEVLYFRRDHPDRTSRGDRRARAAGLGAERASRLRHPMPRMYVEYIYGFLRAVQRAPLSPAERNACRMAVLGWLTGRLGRSEAPRSIESTLDAR